MSARGVFVTGTDTGVGKTWISTRLVAALRGDGIDAVGMKPIECGGRDDSSALHAVSGAVVSLDEVNPVHLPEPVAPAAIGAAIDLEELKAKFDSLAERHEFVVVEGAGGWRVPVDGARDMSDLAVLLGLPVIAVAANRLGVLNHSLLTCKAIIDSGLPLMALFLNSFGPTDPSCATNRTILEKRLAPVPVIEDNLDFLLETCQRS